MTTDTASGLRPDGKSTAGARHVLSTSTGQFISQSVLTLSATSQSLPAAPSNAKHALIQVQGGTVTDLTYIRFDGNAATSSDMVLRNAGDVISSVEIILGGTLADITMLGTANASNAVIWWFT